MKRVLFPLPDRDFDVTEAAVPWKLLRGAGFEVTFSTEQGNVAACDPLLLSGVVFGQLGAAKEAIQFYHEMVASDEFQHPIPYAEIQVQDFEMLHLTGGHAPGMKQYLESKELQAKVAEFFSQGKWIGSICHGAVLLARTIDPKTGRSVIFGRKLSGLTKFLERLAYYITFWRRGKYYRTYPLYVQDEVQAAMQDPSKFDVGTKQFQPHVCVDGNLISARWPKDSYLYAQTLIQQFEASTQRTATITQ